MQLCVSIREAKIRDPELRDQAQRASVSTFLAVSEGLPHASPRMRKQYFERARASAWEVASAIHLAKELGAMDESRWRVSHTLTIRTSAMLVALGRRCV
jgi:four helix bundle protein